MPTPSSFRHFWGSWKHTQLALTVRSAINNWGNHRKEPPEKVKNNARSLFILYSLNKNKNYKLFKSKIMSENSCKNRSHVHRGHERSNFIRPKNPRVEKVEKKVFLLIFQIRQIQSLLRHSPCISAVAATIVDYHPSWITIHRHKNELERNAKKVERIRMKTHSKLE